MLPTAGGGTRLEVRRYSRDMVAGSTMTTWAAQEAGRMLKPLGNRWVHTVAVVERARAVEAANSDVDGEVLVAAAYLHDVGYATKLVRTGHHAIDGALYLRELGLERLAQLVAHHSSSAAEAETRGLTVELQAFPCEASPTADALTYCDLLTGPLGERVTLAERMTDVERRYGASHPVTLALRMAHPRLAAAVARIEQRLGYQSPS